MTARDKRDAGEVLEGRYRLVSELGSGGFGDVWRAAELLPDGSVLREVALKLLDPRMAEHDWAQEARIIASLRHPALVTVYAAGLLQIEPKGGAEAVPVPFVAMELLEGDSLAAFVKRGERVPWRRVLAWAREAAAALDEIHRAGVVHLDLKPANLFLTVRGELKVLDFGIAQQRSGARPSERAPRVPVFAPEPAGELSTAAFVAQREDDAGEARAMGATTRSVAGTPGFMAPEIFEGGEASAASDAYSLAGCLIELASGKLPQRVSERPPPEQTTRFAAWVAELQSATVRGHIRDLGSEEPQWPAALVELLARWLSLDPHARAVERGQLCAALDAVWRRPHGAGGAPYRGLARYGEHDDGRLFARSDEVRRIAAELVSQPCVALEGPTGTGLRSLMHAGVVPELGRAFADQRDDWRPCSIDGAPFDAAIHAWLDAAGAAPGEQPIERLARWAEGANVGVCVVVERAHERDAARLSELCERRAGVRLCVRIDEDVDAKGALEAALRPWLRFVGPIAPESARELVLGPLAAHGLAYDELEPIVRDVQRELREDAARLPLVSLALERWWSSGARDVAGWRKLGGVLGALAAHGEALCLALEPRERESVDALLLRLVSADGSAVALTEAELGADPALLERLLAAQLVRRREGLLAPSHPELGRRWARIESLRLADHERLTALEALREATRRWVHGGRRRGDLWGGRELGEHGARLPLSHDLSEDGRAFLTASRGALRLRWGIRLLLAVVALALVGGVWWLDARLTAQRLEQERDVAEARQREAVGQIVTRSRRAKDPYERIALVAGAIDLGSSDTMLPLELMSAARALPAAQFLSLEPVAQASFPWGERWLVAARGAELSVFDFVPIEGGAERGFAPVEHRFRPHDAGLADVVSFAFASALATRGIDGEVKIWRLRPSGNIVLAAIAPMRCPQALGTVLVAARAPIVACLTLEGLARWDLRAPERVERDAFTGRVLDLSPDGAWLAAARLRTLLLWSPRARERRERELAEAPSAARFSPRDPLLAVVAGFQLTVERIDDPSAPPVFEGDSRVLDAADARWSDGGLDLALCEFSGEGRWHYLRRGGRPAADGKPPEAHRPCEPRRAEWPRPLDRLGDYGELAAYSRRVGARRWNGGWRLEDGRLVTGDLVLFDLRDTRLERLLALPNDQGAKQRGGESVEAVVRDGDRIIWQVGDSVRLHDLDGKEQRRDEGHLLARCPDGQLLAWRKREGRYLLMGLRSNVELGSLPRQPGFVLGADPGCQRVFVQHLDGQLLSALVRGGTLAPVEGSYVIDGFVYDSRASVGRTRAGRTVAPGLWLALSSGAIVRVDDAGKLRDYGHATPRATAMADGPDPGELLFADEGGVWLRRPGRPDRLLWPGDATRAWEDLYVLPGGATAVLSWAHGVALLDVERGGIVGEVDTEARGRLSPWDDEGSLVSWAYSFMGPPQGEIVPFGRTLARKVGKTASNLRGTLGSELRPRLELE